MAPVRETCAQALGVAAARLETTRARRLAEQLAALAGQPQWEARHGALLAYKYLLHANQVRLTLSSDQVIKISILVVFNMSVVGPHKSLVYIISRNIVAPHGLFVSTTLKHAVF